jgi:hypothetical protein
MNDDFTEVDFVTGLFWIALPLMLLIAWLA